MSRAENTLGIFAGNLGTKTSGAKTSVRIRWWSLTISSGYKEIEWGAA